MFFDPRFLGCMGVKTSFFLNSSYSVGISGLEVAFRCSGGGGAWRGADFLFRLVTYLCVGLSILALALPDTMRPRCEPLARRHR